MVVIQGARYMSSVLPQFDVSLRFPSDVGVNGENTAIRLVNLTELDNVERRIVEELGVVWTLYPEFCLVPSMLLFN